MNIYELIGVILGDGYIHYNEKQHVYFLEITGNADEEMDYYHKIQTLLTNLSSWKPKLRIRKEAKGKSLKLILNNKIFLKKLIFDYGLNFKDKTNFAYVPSQFLAWKYMKDIIRGFLRQMVASISQKQGINIHTPGLNLKLIVGS